MIPEGWRPIRLFEVVGKDGKKNYFDYKVPAKTFRDSPLAAKGATVNYGPDHDKHRNNRREHGWNRGKHPKTGWNGGRSKGIKFSPGQRSGGRG